MQLFYKFEILEKVKSVYVKKKASSIVHGQRKRGKKSQKNITIDAEKKHFIIFNTLTCRKLGIKTGYLILIN